MTQIGKDLKGTLIIDCQTLILFLKASLLNIKNWNCHPQRISAIKNCPKRNFEWLATCNPISQTGLIIFPTPFKTPLVDDFYSTNYFRFQGIWEDLCSTRTMYEDKCRIRIQRQLEIGQWFFFIPLVTVKLFTFIVARQKFTFI